MGEDTDMAWDTLDILDTMDTPMPMLTLARDLLMLNLRLRLRLTLPYFTAPMAMVLVTMAMLGWDTMDTPMHTTDLLTTESVPLMLTPTFSMVDMDMDTLDTVDTMDTPMLDMPTLDKLLSPQPYPATENGQNNHQCLLLQ